MTARAETAEKNRVGNFSAKTAEKNRVGDFSALAENWKNGFSKTAEKNRVGNFSDLAEKNSLSLERGEGVTRTHLPPPRKESAPTPCDEPLFFALTFEGRNPPTATAQERRIAAGPDGKPRVYDPPAVKAARASLLARLSRFAPDAPFEGPLRLDAIWNFRDARGRRRGWRDTRPDTDNLQKLLKDCMTAARFWIDDAQVCMEVAEKRWADEPGILIRVAPLGG